MKTFAIKDMAETLNPISSFVVIKKLTIDWDVVKQIVDKIIDESKIFSLKYLAKIKT